MADSIMQPSLPRQRAIAALKTAFTADALAMPVHWYYSPMDIYREFPGGIQGMEPAPEFHPSSIMSLHDTRHGGRRGAMGAKLQPEIVGDVILKGRRQYWNHPNRHYHHGMKAGENTLNAHCARVLMRTMIAHGGHYDEPAFLRDYIAFMTADPPRHPDTYAESYHRGFFANWQAGKPPQRCGTVTHDTPSVGGLVAIAPLVLAERLRGTPLAEVQEICRGHLWLTHPDESLARVCIAYVDLLDQLLFRDESEPVSGLLERAARSSPGLKLDTLVATTRSDHEVIGGKFSPACYISGAWPGVLYLAYKYVNDLPAGLRANCNVGGDNVHRGAVLAALLGLASGGTSESWFGELACSREIDAEILALVQPADFSE